VDLRQIAHYRVTSLLGKGGMGEVYRATDTKLNREVALKLLPTELAGDPQRRQRFINEARAASALNHPNVCTIYEVGETDDGRPFIAMEFLEGDSLAERIRREPFSVQEALGVAVHIVEALEVAHSKGIVHRDIKPANVSLNERSIVKVLDFGLAKQLTSEAATDADATTQYHTQEGGIVGTPYYMSPEQALGRPVDHRTDLFSLGVLLYELVSGRRPFAGSSSTEAIANLIHARPSPMTRAGSELSVDLQRIVLKCLEKDPGNRYQSAADLLVDLRKLHRDGETGIVAGAGTSSAKTRASIGQKAVIAGVILLSILVGYLALRPESDTFRARRLAVLPLDNLSPDPQDEYFAFGVREELDNRLAKLPGITLVGRTSLLKYREGTKDLAQIGRELKVDTVLDGSVHKLQDRVLIRLQLIDVDTQDSLWSDVYRKELKDIFDIQSEIAQHVAAALQVELQLGRKGQLVTPPTANLEAYQEYLKGRFYWSKRTALDVEEAIARFRTAIELDQRFALAHAGLASCYALLPLYSRLPAAEYMPKALNAAEVAIGLDDAVAEAHAVRAWVKAFFEYDWTGAEEAFQVAMERDRNHPTTHHWYSLYLCQLGQFEAALAEIRLARQLDPSSLIINHTVGLVHYLSGHHDLALHEYTRAIELGREFESTFLTTDWFIGIAHLNSGRTEDAIETFERVRPLLGETPFYVGALGRAYALAGRREDALSVLGELEMYAEAGFLVSYDIAAIQEGMGRKNEALKSLRRALAERDWWIGFLKVDPMFRELHDEPEFIGFLTEMGFAWRP